MNKVRLGIIGYGNIGSQHGRSIASGKTPAVDLTAVADINPERLKLAKSVFGEDLKTFDSAEDLIHSGCCDAVLISVPHYYHPSMAIMAMEAGLHVLVQNRWSSWMRSLQNIRIWFIAWTLTREPIRCIRR